MLVNIASNVPVHWANALQPAAAAGGVLSVSDPVIRPCDAGYLCGGQYLTLTALASACAAVRSWTDKRAD